MVKLKDWDDLPQVMRNNAVEPYYKALSKRKASIPLKRIFDFGVGVFMAAVLILPMLIIAALIKLDSKGPVIFRQKRVTVNGRLFYILKFRTMAVNADSHGTEVTVKNDARITRIGHTLRKFRLDELPQIFNVISGDMSFVGTRPEVPKYVARYTPEMIATLLLPAGITSEASINYKDEDELLNDAENAEDTYVNLVLPEKMKFNLRYIENYSFLRDLRIMAATIWAVVKGKPKIEAKTVRGVKI